MDSLSENVRRGFRTKAENGWLPTMAPLGYLNDKESRTVVPDPERFSLLRKMWELMLTGAVSPRRIWEIATREWGLSTKKRKRIGGAPISLSAVYKMFTNPFYAGVLEWSGKTYRGKHTAMVTLDEFERVQELLGRPGRPRRKHHEFAYTGMIRCGECGFSVTAEHKRNRYGSRYTYYHCSKRRLDYQCRQPVIAVEDLERQLLAFLEEIALPDRFLHYGLERLERLSKRHDLDAAAERQSLEQAHHSIEGQLENLTRLRLRDLLTDEEYVRERRELDRDRLRLAQRLTALGNPSSRFELARQLISFNNEAAFRFRAGNPPQRRLILEIAGSNPTLRDQKLFIEAKKPFRVWRETASCSDLRAFVKDVRTFVAGLSSDTARQNILRILRNPGHRDAA